MMIRAVMLDLDNTLYDEHQFVKSGFKAVSKVLAHKFSLNEETVYTRLCSLFLKQERKQVFAQVLNEFSIYNDKTVSEMLEVYRKHLPRIHVFKDVRDVLPILRKEYKLGLITDGLRMVQENKVNALKISDCFNVITYADAYGGKHNQKPFLTTLEQLQVKAHESVYVDDNPRKGFAVAKELGIRTVRILRGENKNLAVDDERSRSDSEINDLHQLVSILHEFDKL